MRVYLVQHGQAHSKDSDPDRHLTEKGSQDVHRLSEFVKHLDLRVSAVWQSGKTRAAQTAQILSTAAQTGEGIVEKEGLAPNDPVGPVAEELSAAKDDVMIVGHMPFLGKLASLLVARDESAQAVAFQQGGVVCLQRDEQNGWAVRWMVTPDMLG